MKFATLLPLVLVLASCLGRKPSVYPVEKCTERHKKSYLYTCVTSLSDACDKEPGMCLDPVSVCAEAVEEICPSGR